MNIHIIRYLSAIALSMITSVALAVDDAIISEIDSKATSAKSKADGNNSRIQALEAEVANIELTPGPQGEQGIQGQGQDYELRA